MDKTLEIIDDDTFNLEGYQVVRGEFFSHIFEPAFTLSQNKVYVNTACLKKLPDVEYVQALVNPESKKLAIRPCNEEEKDSFRWCSNSKKPKQITCRIFFGKIFELMNWNPTYRYKLLGKLIRSKGELVFSFDLSNPEIFERKNGKTTRTPLYPEDWKDQFGLTVEEHQKNLPFNTFDGYTVFSIEKETPDKSVDDDGKEGDNDATDSVY